MLPCTWVTSHLAGTAAALAVASGHVPAAPCPCALAPARAPGAALCPSKGWEPTGQRGSWARVRAPVGSARGQERGGENPSALPVKCTGSFLLTGSSGNSAGRAKGSDLGDPLWG